MQKKVKEFLKDIEEQGWSWEKRRSGHLCLRGPNGEIAFASATPSDHRALDNLRSDMRRATKTCRR